MARPMKYTPETVKKITDALTAGDAEAGGTVYRLSDSMDGGQIIMQRRCAVLPGEGAVGLWRRALSPMGVSMLRDVVTAMGLERHAKDAA